MSKIPKDIKVSNYIYIMVIVLLMAMVGCDSYSVCRDNCLVLIHNCSEPETFHIPPVDHVCNVTEETNCFNECRGK